MIQIDDAGSGSLVGGTCIGVIRTETSEYNYDIIPLKYYDEYNFKNKTYLNITTEIVKEIFKKLNVRKEENIEVCRGYMFDNLRYWLKENGFKFNNVKILNPLQDKIENSFEKYALSLGLPKKFLSYTKYPFHFHRLLKWVYADFNNRKKLCKTGWKSFMKYSSIHIDVKYSIIDKDKYYYCLKCGNKIDIGPVKVLKYISNNHLNIIYLHTNC